jgi:biotin carboxylase
MAPLTILCLASYKKGDDFLRQARREGARVLLLTSKSLEGADWPREAIDQTYYIPDKNKEWQERDLIYGVSYMARSEPVDRIVALDDFDVERAATLREHLRIPGMGETTARYFRDKLAMRTRAAEAHISIPNFVHVLHDARIRAFTERTPPPYVLKPRLQAGAIGIKIVTSVEQLWQLIEQLGDERSFYLLESFIRGDIFHVDTLVDDYEVRFAIASRYGTPPLEVSHQGRVFSTCNLPWESPLARDVIALNARLLRNLGLKHGASHSEFICDEASGRFYFLETSARVGGAHIVDLVQAATGLNLWAEWARIECQPEGTSYAPPEFRKGYAGLLVSLARQEWPDLAPYNDAEVVWRLKKKNHAGLIVASASHHRVRELLEKLTQRFYADFFAAQPPRDKPMD